jgi:hypothetical protein
MSGRLKFICVLEANPALKSAMKVVRADDKLTAFLELERAVCIHLVTERV